MDGPDVTVMRQRGTFAEALELQHVAGLGTVTSEVGDLVTVQFTLVKDEGVVPAVAGETVLAAASIEDVVTAVADHPVVERVAGQSGIAGIDHRRVLYPCCSNK